MEFCEKLNEYIINLSCTAKDICELSGISAATFSRYKNGKYIPEYGTQNFERLCSAITEVARQKNISNITCESVKNEFLLVKTLFLSIRSF